MNENVIELHGKTYMAVDKEVAQCTGCDLLGRPCIAAPCFPHQRQDRRLVKFIEMKEEAEHIEITAPPEPAITAPGLLHRAAEIMEERGKQYDNPEGERSMDRCVRAFNAITGRDLTESEGWLLLQVLKDVRQWQRTGYHADSAEDCIAYAALKAEALAKGGT